MCFRTLSKEFYKIRFQFGLYFQKKTHEFNTLTPLCFQKKKRRFLSLDINISLKQHKDTYGFHKRRSCWTKPVNIDLRAQHSLQFSPSKPILSLKTFKRDKDSLKAIHFTNIQVYEYFPDWFRSGSMNSPITQVSIKLDRFIPFKVLQLVCMQKNLS